MDAQATASTDNKEPLSTPPPDYGSASLALSTSPALGGAIVEHSHAPMSAEQDIQYHQLFTQPSTAVDLLSSGLPVAKLIETYPETSEYRSNDPKLNDVNVLYDYLRLKALDPVRAQVYVHGSHTETEVYYVYKVNPHNNQREQVRQTRTITVTDFNFTVPLFPLATGEATQTTLWTLDERPEANLLPFDVREAVKWKTRNGLPGWADPAATRELYNLRNSSEQIAVPALASSPKVVTANIESPAITIEEKDLELGLPTMSAQAGLKEVCESYVKDRGRLKQLEMKVGLYGWDMDKVVKAIENCIHATGYHSTIVVSFSSSPKRYIVRPFNSLTKLKRNFWLMVLACVTLVYPCIWLFLWASGKNGGKYRNVRADPDALKFYKPVEGTFPGEALAKAHTRLHPHVDNAQPSADDWAHRELVTGPLGVYVLCGLKEGVWLRKWETRIVEAAINRFQGDLQDGVEAGRILGNGLDVY